MTRKTHKPKGSGAPDFGFMVTPADYTANYSDQPVFRLKTDFPTEKPARLPAFVQQIDFRKNPLEYLTAARDYSFDGNLPDWNPFENDKARGITSRGCTRPRPARTPIRPTVAPRASAG